MEESNRYANKFKKKKDILEEDKPVKKLQVYKKPKYKQFKDDEYV